MYINILHLPLFNFAYLFFLFFPFLSTYLLVLFSLLYSQIGILLSFCFPVSALVNFVLVDIIFGFLCSPGQSILLYFCWTVLTLCICTCVYSIILIIIWLTLDLPFVWGSSLVSHFWVFVLILLNAITNHLWNFCS